MKIANLLLSITISVQIFLFFQQAHAANNVSLTYEAGEDNLTELFLKYEISAEGIILGDVILNDAVFSMALDSEEKKLSVYWPSEVLRNGKLELVKSDGTAFYSQTISESQLEIYTTNAVGPIRNSYHNLRTEIPFLSQWKELIKRSGTFWVCLRSDNSEGDYVQICSSPYKLIKSGLKIASTNTANKVFFNESKELPLKNDLPLALFETKKIRWFAQIESGLSWLIYEKVPPWKPIEIVAVDANTYRISGLGFRPLRYLTDHFTYKQHAFFYEFKPKPFQNENEEYWLIHVQVTKELNLSFMSPLGGIYTARINLAKVPNVLDSPIVLGTQKPQLTYSSSKLYRISVTPNQKIAPSKNIKTTKQTNQYLFSTGNLKKGEVSKSTLRLMDENNQGRSYFLEAYRGYSTDFGLQYTASSISGNSTQGTELHLAYWAEDMFELLNEDWFRLRFGVQFKYFKPFKKLMIAKSSTSSETKEIDVASSVFDIKYRFVPGLWGRDESFGIMLSQHDFTFDTYKLNLLGGGFFWARSMPKVFDDLFNFVPIFRYPKWVSTEYIQFFAGGANNVQLKAVSHLNFYGKVMWTNSFYGDLGFGMRTYNFKEKSTTNSPALNLFFLTFGIGVVF